MTGRTWSLSSRLEATAGAFAAIREDGEVVTWGHRAGGGDSSSVQAELRNVKQIQGSRVQIEESHR